MPPKNLTLLSTSVVESNDTLLTATDTTLSITNTTFTATAQIGDNSNIAPELDVDLFKVQLNAGDQLTIDIDAEILGSSLDSYLILFDQFGTRLTYSDDTYPTSYPYYSLDSLIDFTATSTGTYYIGVSSGYNDYYDPTVEGSGYYYSDNTGEYTLKLTLTPPRELFGTSGDDTLVGVDSIDFIYALAGNDTIFDLANNDQIFAGAGDDLIYNGSGNDIVNGDDGNDLIYDGEGDDQIFGGDGVDVIFGSDGYNFIDGGLKNDRLFGGNGNDQLNGGDGNDIINTGEGNNTAYGGSGKDRINGGYYSDQLFGEAGNDQINGAGGNDTLEGGDGNDTLEGGTDSDSLFGGLGTDKLFGGTGSDTLEGGAGNDTLLGASSFGEVDYYGYGEVDTLTGGLGKDTFVLGDAVRIYYDDGDATTSGESGYALITDFNLNQDVIQLKGTADVYSFDFFTTDTGALNAALIYDAGSIARGEVIAILQNVSSTLSLSNSAFQFV